MGCDQRAVALGLAAEDRNAEIAIEDRRERAGVFGPIVDPEPQRREGRPKTPECGAVVAAPQDRVGSAT